MIGVPEIDFITRESYPLGSKNKKEGNNMSLLKEINIFEIEGFHVGNGEYRDGATGCTVFLPDQKACCGLDIRGGAPASRESGLLNPLAANDGVHAVVLSGGSAYGLDCASGVMKYLEEKGVGFPVGNNVVVPIVCASCILDLGLVDAYTRPDKELGYKTCLNAEKNNYQDGNYGAGTGATCGKFLGPNYMMKSGIGSCAYQLKDLKVGAIVCTNCAGDIYDDELHQKIAGAYDANAKTFLDSEDALYSMQMQAKEGMNTTIGIIFTNAKFNKTELTKIAGFGHDGMARAIKPIHTMFDGDSLYALSLGDVKADINVVGTIASKAVAKAIANSAYSSKEEFGLLSAQSLRK